MTGIVWMPLRIGAKREQMGGFADVLEGNINLSTHSTDGTPERYDSNAAAHYAAYRPALHSMILARALPRGASFDIGLDIGCGTGYSAVALAEYCNVVHGIDPSPSMLERAIAHEQVHYVDGAAEHIPLPSDAVDVITFAGSLFYVNVDVAGEEVRRVGRVGATVIAYDFEILLEHVLRQCGIDSQANASGYDHSRNFSGVPGFNEVAVRSEQVTLSMSPAEAAHVLLSDSYRYDRLAARYRTSDPFEAVAEELRSAYERVAVAADLYYSTYRLVEE